MSGIAHVDISARSSIQVVDVRAHPAHQKYAFVNKSVEIVHQAFVVIAIWSWRMF